MGAAAGPEDVDGSAVEGVVKGKTGAESVDEVELSMGDVGSTMAVWGAQIDAVVV